MVFGKGQCYNYNSSFALYFIILGIALVTFAITLLYNSQIIHDCFNSLYLIK